MTMFDLVIGNAGWPPSLMEAWNLEPEIIARYRDHWCEHGHTGAFGEDGDLVLALYMRIGGDNRQDYAEQIAALRATPRYVDDRDDEFDPTYCTFRFVITKSDFFQWMQEAEDQSEPDETRPSHELVWSELWDASEPWPRDMSKVWRAMLQRLEERS